MKKLLVILFASALIYACGSNEGGDAQAPDTSATENTTPAPAAGQVSADAEKALELIAGSDCMACHAIDRKLIGPSYEEVAAKYEATDAVIDTLIHKIQKGGTGNWGNIPMTPHPDLSDADAKTMVHYILSLKK